MVEGDAGGIEPARQPQRLGYLLEQAVEIFEAQKGEHLRDLGICVRNKWRAQEIAPSSFKCWNGGLTTIAPTWLPSRPIESAQHMLGQLLRSRLLLRRQR